MNINNQYGDVFSKVSDSFKPLKLSDKEKDWIVEALTQVKQQKDIDKLEGSLAQHFQKLQSFEPERLMNTVKGVKIVLNKEKADQETHNYITHLAKSCMEEIIKSYSQSSKILPIEFSQYSQKLQQEFAIETAKFNAQRHGEDTSYSIQNYGIKSDTPEGQQALIEIAKLTARQSGYATSLNIKKYGIKSNTSEGQQALIEIAKLAAQQDGRGTSAQIQKYGIKSDTPEGQQALIEIAMLAAQQNGSGTSDYIQRYGINSDTPEGQQALIEIAKLAAQQNGRGTSEYIQRYGIKSDTSAGQQALIEIAKLAAQQNGMETLLYIQNYGIKSDTPERKRAFEDLLNWIFISIILQLPNFSGRSIEQSIEFFKSQNLSPDGISTYSMKEFLELGANLDEGNRFTYAGKCLNLCEKKFNLTGKDLEWFQDAMLKNDEPFNQMRLVEWFIALAALNSSHEDVKKLFKEHQNILMGISKLNPRLREALSKEFIHISLGEKAASFKKLQEISEKTVHVQLAGLLFANFPPEGEPIYIQALRTIKDERMFRDGKHQNLLLETLLKIEKCKLTAGEKTSLIEKLFSMPVEVRLQSMRLVSDLIAFEGESYLLKVHNFNDLQLALEKAFKNKFDVQLEDFSDKYQKTIGSWRNQDALKTYAGKLNELTSPEKAQAQTFLKTLLTDILNQSFQKNRYATENNPHLAEISRQHPEVFTKWQQSLQLEPDEIEVKASTTAKSVNDLIIGNLKEALVQNHLGREQQASLYPLLTECIGKWDQAEESLKKLEALLVPLSGRPLSKDEMGVKKNLLLQKSILMLLNNQSGIEKQLNDLKSLIDKGMPFYQDMESFIKLLNKPDQSQPKKYQVIDTDDPNHFLLMGTEVENSCQKINGAPSLNKCLLGYFLDGKHRLGLVCDDQGRILARSVFRLLIDAQGKPVLYQERIYVADASPEYTLLLKKLALKKAASLGIPLVVSKKDFEQEQAVPYPHAVKAMDKPVPFEYVDAIGGPEAIQSGAYTIPEAMQLA